MHRARVRTALINEISTVPRPKWSSGWPNVSPRPLWATVLMVQPAALDVAIQSRRYLACSGADPDVLLARSDEAFWTACWSSDTPAPLPISNPKPAVGAARNPQGSRAVGNGAAA